MAKGFDTIREASADIQSRSGGGGPGALYFRLQDGEETKVRFLEQDEDITWCWMHEIPVEGRQWGRQVPCLDQNREGDPCPGCEAGLDRKFRGFINLIWDDAPVFKRDGEGRIVRDQANDPIVLGTKPQVAVWSSGIRLFEELDEIDSNFKGLRSRRFKVKRKRKKLDTKYVIVPEDIDAGPQDFSADESALEKEKFDLNQFITPPNYEEWSKQLYGGGQNGNGNGGGQGQPQNVNPFMRRN